FEDGPAGAVADHLTGGELPLAQAAEQVQLARVIRAGNEVQDAVAVEVHELRTGADASVNGNLGIDAAGLEVHRLGVPRLLVGAPVAVHAEQAAKVADDKVPDAVAVDVHDPGTGVPPGLAAVDQAVRRFEAQGRVEQ